MAHGLRSFTTLTPLMEAGSEPPIQDKGRVCAMRGCGTVLSIYNGSAFCWQHDLARTYTLPGPQQRSRRERVGKGSPARS
jgi:hypothetical protein